LNERRLGLLLASIDCAFFFFLKYTRAAYICIIKKKLRKGWPLTQTPLPHSGPSCEGLLYIYSLKLMKQIQPVRPDLTKNKPTTKLCWK
jgi:hypothetical protein